MQTTSEQTIALFVSSARTSSPERSRRTPETADDAQQTPTRAHKPLQAALLHRRNSTGLEPHPQGKGTTSNCIGKRQQRRRFRTLMGEEATGERDSYPEKSCQTTMMRCLNSLPPHLYLSLSLELPLALRDLPRPARERIATAKASGVRP